MLHRCPLLYRMLLFLFFYFLLFSSFHTPDDAEQLQRREISLVFGLRMLDPLLLNGACFLFAPGRCVVFPLVQGTIPAPGEKLLALRATVCQPLAGTAHSVLKCCLFF